MKKIKILLFLLIGLIMTNCAPYGDISTLEFDEVDYPYQVHKVKIFDDIEVAYVDEGNSDQTILFVHGLGSYLPAWKKNIEGLKNNYRCIAIDLPGYGKSSKGVYPFSMDFYADVINAVVEELDLKNVTLAGHSLGGQIAISTALKYPEAISKLVLVAPAGFETFNEGQREWFRNIMTVRAVKLTPVNQIRDNVYVNFYNMPEDAEFMITDRIRIRNAKDFDKYCYAVVESVSAMVNTPVFNLLGNITQPTLILFGENDQLIPNRYLNPGFTKDVAESGAGKIPNSKLVMFEECGHFLQFEKSEEFNQEIKDFLK